MKIRAYDNAVMIPLDGIDEIKQVIYRQDNYKGFWRQLNYVVTDDWNHERFKTFRESNGFPSCFSVMDGTLHRQIAIAPIPEIDGDLLISGVKFVEF